MRLIVLEGCDGSGTTSHARALVESLRSHGYLVAEFHHPRHLAHDTDWSRSLHYALERAHFVMHNGPIDVAVADRWWHSNESLAYTFEDPLRSSILDLCHLEKANLPNPLLTMMLDAPDVVLDARLKDGRSLDAWEARMDHARKLRAVYREEIAQECQGVFNTDGSKEEVQARILKLTLRALA
jgi:thymidylate kinase